MHSIAKYSVVPVGKTDINQLVDRLNNNSVVAYVGGGPTIAAKLPAWANLVGDSVGLLRNKFGPTNGHKPTPDRVEDLEDLRSIISFHQDGNLNLCAELIELHHMDTIGKYIIDTYGDKKLRSTSIHQEIARVPFSLVFTTNYDQLLENAYEEDVRPLTWQSGEELFRNLRQNEFSIVKLHGCVSDPQSIILTKSQYFKSFKPQAIQTALEHLFSFKTLLFIGSSLRDPNLHQVIKRSRSALGAESYGPHYAIMFDDEVDNAYCNYLWDMYKIAVILCKKPVGATSSEWHTEAVSSVLKDISGKATLTAYNNHRSPNLISSDFHLKEAASDILEEVLERTGSISGFVVYSYDVKLQQLSIASAKVKKGSEYVHLSEATKPTLGQMSKRIGPDSPISNLFLQSYNRYVPYYISDIKHPSKKGSISAPQYDYKPICPNVRSVLLCPVRSDGELVGFLVIESRNLDTYTKDHKKAILVAAQLAGAAFSEYEHRKVSTKGIESHLDKVENFFELMDKNRQLSRLDMSYILYEVDYNKGTLTAHVDERKYPPDPSTDPFVYHFKDQSLATETLRRQQKIFIKNVRAALELDDPIINEKGIKRFNIKGSVLSFPIRIDGRISSILVAWSGSGNPELKKLSPRIQRLSHLIVNDPDRNTNRKLIDRCSLRFLERLNIKLRQHDNGRPWEMANLLDPDFRNSTLDEILSTLTENSCGLQRVRLWEHIEEAEMFECIYSYCSAESLNSNDPIRGRYRGEKMFSSDIYSQHSVRRAATDPHTRFQHIKMFNKPDLIGSRLHKDPNGFWFVAPIVSRDKTPRLLGYIAADNHCMIDGKPTDSRPVERKEQFQQYALDHVADLLVDTMRIMRLERVNGKATT